jgi:hypothetical protein
VEMTPKKTLDATHAPCQAARQRRNGGGSMVSTVVETPIAVLVGALRELPEGLATPVTAGLLVSDVLRCIGWSEVAIAALAPEIAALEVVGIGVVEGGRAA